MALFATFLYHLLKVLRSRSPRRGATVEETSPADESNIDR
ncbi:MAG: hypothetical protein BWY72_01681 [Bacteroidetes bacterium ADurb.Bin416]|nr:MAG: hypothetical protein BWY72_01681 [Bacteroidetes bacterium ADurb.Bin416]